MSQLQVGDLGQVDDNVLSYYVGEVSERDIFSNRTKRNLAAIHQISYGTAIVMQPSDPTDEAQAAALETSIKQEAAKTATYTLNSFAASVTSTFKTKVEAQIKAGDNSDPIVGADLHSFTASVSAEMVPQESDLTATVTRVACRTDIFPRNFFFPFCSISVLLLSVLYFVSLTA